MSTEIPTTNETPQQPGKILQVEREKRGITTKQVAEVLNLPERFIVYLEAGEFSSLPGNTFVRGYIRNYAKYLGLKNTEELVSLLDVCVGDEAVDRKVLDFKQIKRFKSVSTSIYWLVSFVVCLILAGVVFLIWQHFANNDNNYTAMPVEQNIVSVESSSVNDTQVQNTIPLVTNDGLSIPLTSTDQVNDSQTENTVKLPIENTTQNTGKATVETAAVKLESTEENKETTQAEQNTKVEQPAQNLKKGEGTIAASFTGNCWVSITDATGKVLVNKLYVANTNLNVTGKAPLDVVLGAPVVVTMTYNGEPVAINQQSSSTHRIKLGK